MTRDHSHIKEDKRQNGEQSKGKDKHLVMVQRYRTICTGN